jgi:hypothetical protein
MQFEAIFYDLNFQKWDNKQTNMTKVKKLQQDCLSLKKNADFNSTILPTVA